MVRLVVIADDLTGANATGAMYARLGLAAVAVTSLGAGQRIKDDVDVVVFNTDSRHATTGLAAARIAEVMDVIADWDVQVVKRVDTTLRGRLATESAGVLRRLREQYQPQRVVGLCAPAFPRSGRVTIGGMQLLEGTPIERTWAASDPFSPVTDSRVARLITGELGLSAVEVDLHELLTDPVSAVSAAAQAADFVVVDAATDEDIATLARAAVRVAATDGVRWLIIDSGPVGAAYAQEAGLVPRSEGDGRILVVAGSLTDRTREQIDHLEIHTDAKFIEVGADSSTTAMVAALRTFAESYPIIGVRTAPPTGPVDAATAAVTLAKLRDLAAAAVAALRPAGIYVTGGDVAAQAVAALGADGFRIIDEVIPLAVVGRLSGGPWDGLGFATKGGLIGDANAATMCVNALRALPEKG